MGSCLRNESLRTECRGEGECRGEDECRDSGGESREGFRSDDEDDPRVEDHDAGHDYGSDYANKSGRTGDVRERRRGRRRKGKCPTRGAAAPAPWIVDPRPRAEEGNINDEDMREEDFFPSRQIEVNEESLHLAIGYTSLPKLLTQPPEPENQVLHYPGYHFVLDLVLACRCFLSNENDPIAKIFQFLSSTNQYSAESESGRTVMAVDSLENLAARCSQAEENIAVTHFVFMLNAIQLRCKVIRFVSPISCSVLSEITIS